GVSDEVLAPVMGRIMFDAVVKMPSPVFICDSAERIIWYNSATESLGGEKKLYGKPISELFIGTRLEDIRTDRSASGYPVSYESRAFNLRYSHIKTEENDFALIMSEETTQLQNLADKMAGDEPIVCYIIVDNLSEMMQYDSEQYKPAIVKIDEVIRTWSDEYGGILKEYERDKYLFITESRALAGMIASKFDILDRVRSVGVGDSNLPLTISMGVSNISGTFEEKEKAAHAALDMALQRGGDQAAVKSDDSLDFFGGLTKTVQKRTNVRARVISSELISKIKSATNVLIMGHKYADFDSFGSCVGLARLAMYCGARVNVVINMADRNLMGCRKMLEGEEEYLGVFVGSGDALDLIETGTLLIVSDVNNLAISEEPELTRRTERLVVIDHHRKMSEFEREVDIEYIEPSASSACELVAEMLEQVLGKEAITGAEANLMLAGITLDTKQFTKNTGTRTFSAAMYLRDSGASPALVQPLFKESFDDYMREAKFRAGVEIYRSAVAITVVDDADSSPEDRIIAAKAADNLLMVDGIAASFALIVLGDTVHISARSTGKMNVQLILESMGGGGHFDAAGAQCKDRNASDIVAQLKKEIDRYLDGAASK
ncbi:MAG: DHH family phosphoesterase, partial [Clostridia bacterium]|nr:DHH family phosphoesterase [Clostridia bacterium]